MLSLLDSIFSIVNSSMHLISEKKRLKYKKKYHELLTEINRMENLDENELVDSDLGNLYDELFIFFKAFSSELKKPGKANLP